MYSPDSPVSRRHLNTLLPGLDERFEDHAYRRMKELVHECAVLALGDALGADLVAGQVSDKDAGVFGRFTPQRARNVAEGHVYRIGRFVARELRKLGFVGGDNNRCNRCADR